MLKSTLFPGHLAEMPCGSDGCAAKDVENAVLAKPPTPYLCLSQTHTKSNQHKPWILIGPYAQSRQ